MILKSEQQQVMAIGIKRLQHIGKNISSSCPKSLILQMINCLKSNQVNIGPPCIYILRDFLSDQILEDADIKYQLTVVLESADPATRCRLYEISTYLAVQKYSSFTKISFIIDHAVNELSSGEDVLLHLNLMEILQSLCLQDYGLAYLEEKHVLRNLTKRIEGGSENAFISLLLPGIMKFFGSVAIRYPKKFFREYASIYDLLFNCLLEDELVMINVALDSLGCLSRFNESKKAIDTTFGAKYCQVITHIYHNISNYPSDVKPRAFNCLANMFTLEEGSEGMVNNQTLYICEKWYTHIFGSSHDLTSLLNFCKNPFEDLSQSAFEFVKILAVFQFGQQGISNTGGFIEYLLDRNKSISFELKTLKFEIVETLSRSTVFDAITLARLSQYVREGINFIQPVGAVSFDSAS